MNEKELNEIKEEVYKCSKCALCKSVCPVYAATKNEMYLPRGRFIILNRFFNNGKKLSKEFIKDLDKCLNCNKCKDFCPSSIDSVKIFTQLKSIYNYKFSVINFSIFYRLFLYINAIKSIFKKRVKIKHKHYDNPDKIVYFQGCVNKYINPSDRNAVLNILKKIGYTNIVVNGNCCGLPMLSDGETEEFRKNSVQILTSVPEDTKYIICSCDSCHENLKTVLKGSKYADKLISFDEFLKINNYYLPENNANTVYHMPLIRKNHPYLSNDIKVLNEKVNCTLMENFLRLKNKKFAQSINDKVKYADEQTDGKVIITTCLQSKLGIEQQKYKAQVLSYAEYIERMTK